MKGVIILVIVIAVIYFGLSDSTKKIILFNGAEYRLAREEGGGGFHKFHYTKSGKDTGKNDYVEIFKFDKNELTNEGLTGTREMLKKAYQANYINGSSGQFGAFGKNNQNFAYLISSETADIYWFLNFIIQSGETNFSDARSNANNMLTELNDLLNSII